MIKYEWKKGDSLCKVAKKFNIPPYEICKNNEIENIECIEVGQVLVIKP